MAFYLPWHSVLSFDGSMTRSSQEIPPPQIFFYPLRVLMLMILRTASPCLGPLLWKTGCNLNYRKCCWYNLAATSVMNC